MIWDTLMDTSVVPFLSTFTITIDGSPAPKSNLRWGGSFVLLIDSAGNAPTTSASISLDVADVNLRSADLVIAPAPQSRPFFP
jgi:hypothetical protein